MPAPAAPAPGGAPLHPPAAGTGAVRFGAIANPRTFGWYRRWVALAEDAALTTLQERYDSRHHASPATAEHNARLIEDLGLVDFLADRSVIAGPPERCVERIAELADLGVTNILVHHQANDPIEFMETFKASVTPFASLAA